MKFLAALLLFSAITAQAEGPLDCFLAAKRDPGTARLDERAVAGLCNGATSSYPVRCYNEVSRNRTLSLSTGDALHFCSGAVERPPLNCYQAAQRHPRTRRLSSDTQVELCVAATTDEPVRCFAAAERHMSPAAAIQLCVKKTTCELR